MKIKNVELKNYWIITYVAVFLIPIILLSGVLFKVEDTVMDFSNSYSSLLLGQTKNKFDDEIKNIYQFTMNLSSFEQLKEISELDEITVDDSMKYYNIENNIFKSATNYNIDANSFIYFKNSDTVLTRSGFISSYSAYLQYTTGYDISYEEWMNKISGESSFDYWKLSGKNTGTIDKLYVNCPVKNEVYLSQIATAVICVNSSKISDMLEKSFYGGTVFLVSDDGNNVFTFGDEIDYPNDIEIDKLIEDDTHTEKNIKNDKYIFSAGKFSMGRYKYLVAVPINAYAKRVSFLKFWLFLLVLLTIGFTIVIVVKMVKKNYRPIEELVNQIKSTVLEDDNDGVVTYESIDDIKKNLIAYTKNYNYGQKAIQASRITRLLNYEIENFKGDELNGLFSEYDNGSLVVAFDIDKYDDFFDNESESEKIDTIHFMITNVLSEMLDDIYFLTSPMKKMLVCIVACDYEKKDEFNKRLIEKLKQFIDFFEENFGFKVYAAIGSYEKDTLGIRESYTNAQDTMLYKTVFRDENILEYDRVSGRENKYYFSAEDIRILSNYIKVKDSEQAIKFIDEIFEDNIYVKQISYKYIRILLFEIIITIRKSMEDIDEITDIGDNEIFKILQNYENVETFKEDIMLFVENVLNSGGEKKTESNICKKIIEYINENYSNCNLSNDDIALHCNLSKSYLSTIFKKEKNENLVSYITRFRVEKSKELLILDVNVAETANRSGFVNSNTYIRAFKKYEGITPGMWRKKLDN